MVSDEAVRAARAEGMLPLVRMFSGPAAGGVQPQAVAIPGINPDGWTMPARTAICTGFLADMHLPPGTGAPVMLPANGYLIWPGTVRAFGAGDLLAGAAALNDLILSAANVHMQTVVRGGLINLPTHYVPVPVPPGSFFVHPFDVAAIGAGDVNRGLEFLASLAQSVQMPAP